MLFFLSPWYIGLSVVSLLVMAVELWGLWRACRRHNASPMSLLCGRNTCFPTRSVMFAVIGYILLTILYLLLPPFLHDVLP